jgi:hypothetical protein
VVRCRHPPVAVWVRRIRRFSLAHPLKLTPERTADTRRRHADLFVHHREQSHSWPASQAQNERVPGTDYAHLDPAWQQGAGPVSDCAASFRPFPSERHRQLAEDRPGWPQPACRCCGFPWFLAGGWPSGVAARRMLRIATVFRPMPRDHGVGGPSHGRDGTVSLDMVPKAGCQGGTCGKSCVCRSAVQSIFPLSY